MIDLSDSNYRVVFLWAAISGGVALFPMVLTLREWRVHGGPDHYIPPGSKAA